MSVHLKRREAMCAGRQRLLAVGIPFQVTTLIMAILTVLLTLCGFAGERAGIALPIDVKTGFALALGWGLVCTALALCGQVALGRLRRAARMAIAPQD